MVPLTGAVDDLVAANRILARRNVLDEYGHMSLRDPADAQRFYMSRVSAPAMVTADGVAALDLQGRPVGESGKRYHGERFIHSEIYRARPDVAAVVHCHNAALILFGVTGMALRPIYHMAGFLGPGVPVFEIRDVAGLTDMQISSPGLGEALATALGDRAVVLMRGHGAVIVGSSVKQAVYRAIYAIKNAEMQLAAPQPEKIAFLAAEEAAKFDAMLNVDRAWELWKSEIAGTAPVLSA